MKSDRKNAFTRLLLGGMGVHGPVREPRRLPPACGPGLPYALSGPLQDSTRKTTNDSKCTSLLSLISFFVAINALSVPVWGPQSTLQPRTPPSRWPWRVRPSLPVGPPRPILLALWEAFEKEQVLQACLARPTPGYRWPETILSPDGRGPL